MTQLEFFDGEPPAQRHSPTSVAAAEAIRPAMNRLQQLVLDFIRLQGEAGATDEEMQDCIPMLPSTQRPRRIELQRRGLIRQCGERKVRSGRMAAVWRAI